MDIRSPSVVLIERASDRLNLTRKFFSRLSVATAATESSALIANPFKPKDFNPLRLSEDDFCDFTAANGDSSFSENHGGADGSTYNSDEDESETGEDRREDLCLAATDLDMSVVFQNSSGDHSIAVDSK